MKEERIELDIGRIMKQMGIRSQDDDPSHTHPGFFPGYGDSGTRSDIGLRQERSRSLKSYGKPFSAKSFGNR